MKFYTVKEALGMLPVNISERAFRRRLRQIGAGRANGRQLFLTQSDFDAYLDSLKPENRQWASNSSGAAPRARGMRTARFLGNASEEALKLIAEKKRSASLPVGRKRLLTVQR